MSKVSELIEQLCPDGVEYFKLESIFELRNGYTPSKKNPSFWENGTVPWFRMEDIRANGRILDRSLQMVHESAVKGKGLFPANSIICATSATIGEHALIEVDFLSNQRFTCLSLRDSFKHLLDMKFAFYYCFILDEWCKNNTHDSSFSSVDMGGFKRFPFPVPPKEIQREIVEVLDAYAEAEAELEKKLQEELKARRAQYAYYRDKLLDFDHGGGVRLMALGEIGLLERGKRFTASDYAPEGIGSIHYGEIYTHYGLSATETISHLPESMRSKLRFAHSGDLIIAATGENVEDLCKSVVWLGEEHVAVHDDCYIFRSDADPKYIAHCLLTSRVVGQKKKLISSGKVSRISGKNLGRIKIPVPSLEEQRRIVAVLDTFDALVGDISIGLSAEVEARRKQYEHYRDDLLVFREAAA